MSDPSTETVQSFHVVTCHRFSWRLREFSTSDEGFFHSLQTRFSLIIMQLWEEVGPWCFLCDTISSCRIKPFLSPFNPPPSFSQQVCWKRKLVPHQSWCTAVTGCTKLLFSPLHPSLPCLMVLLAREGLQTNALSVKLPLLIHLIPIMNCNVSGVDWTLLSYSFWNYTFSNQHSLFLRIFHSLTKCMWLVSLV